MEGNAYFICVSCYKGEVSENAEMQIIISYNCSNSSLLTRHFVAKIISTVFMLENFFLCKTNVSVKIRVLGINSYNSYLHLSAHSQF